MHVPTVVEAFWLLIRRSFRVIGEQLLLKAKPAIMIQEKGKWVLSLPFSDSFYLCESQDNLGWLEKAICGSWGMWVGFLMQSHPHFCFPLSPSLLHAPPTPSFHALPALPTPLSFQRVLQREGEGQGSGGFPKTAREATTGRGPERLPGLDHTGGRHRP